MNPLLIKTRSLARKTGVIRLINRLRPAASYEQRVHEALVNAIKPGDVVWDVGANVGIYSQLFSEWVGESGFVVAFEPSEESCESIRQRVPDCAWLQVENVALGDSDMTGLLVIGGIRWRTTSRLVRRRTEMRTRPLWRFAAAIRCASDSGGFRM